MLPVSRNCLEKGFIYLPIASLDLKSVKLLDFDANWGEMYEFISAEMKITHQYLYSEKHCNLLWWYWQEDKTHYTRNASEEGKEVGFPMRDSKAKLSCQTTSPSRKRLRMTALFLFIIRSALFGAWSCTREEGQRKQPVKMKTKVATADLIQSVMKYRGNASEVQHLPWWLQTGMLGCLLINIQQTRGGLPLSGTNEWLMTLNWCITDC